LRHLSKEEWMFLLSDKTTDWAANLVLYHLFKKEAFDFAYSNIKDRTAWLIKKKYQDDILYWKEYLD